jgi:opacity protein-like surface antigen
MRKLIISLAAAAAITAAAAAALARPVPGHAPVFPVAPRVWCRASRHGGASRRRELAGPFRTGRRTRS